MTRAEDLLQALNGIKKAADNELSGEAHEEALLYVEELFRLAGFDGEDGGDGGSQTAPAFADAIAQVRAQAQGELSGSSFYLASQMLDDLVSLSPQPASPSVEHAAPVSADEGEAAPLGASFDELAAASKVRVKEAAVSLGMEIVDHYAPVLDDHHEADAGDDPFAGMEFERRSSEPCSMPEIEIIPAEPAPAEHAAPVSFTGAPSPAAAEAEAGPSGASFDDLAAAAKARVEAAAASLGMEIVNHYAPVLDDHHEADAGDDPFAGMEFERRSSEPCSMPEIEPIPEEAVTAPVAAPVDVDAIEAGSAREVAEAAHDFGSLAMQAEPMAEYAARHASHSRQSDASVRSESEEALREAEPAHEDVEAAKRVTAAPEAAAQEPIAKRQAKAPWPVREVPPVTVIKKVETGPREIEKHPEKTFFSLWLDMVFGRKK